MNTEITKKPDNFLAPIAQKSAWGEAPKLSAKDIIIPRMMLMQGMSEKVTAGDAAFGDLRDSVSNELLASPKKPMDIIPFSMKKTIIVSEWDAKTKDYEYKEVIACTPENEALPYEADGFKRQHVMSFFVLLPEDIKAGSAIPKVISFKGKSMSAARVLATQMYALNAAATPWLPPPAFVMTLSVKIDKNDKGTFAILEAKKGRPTTEEELAKAFTWFEALSMNAGNVKIDDEEASVEDVTSVVQEKLAGSVIKTPVNLKDPGKF